MGDAAESELRGEVAFKFTGGVVRYRSWPALRRPVLAIFLVLMIVGTGVVGHVVLESLLHGVFIMIGFTAIAAPFFFPTLVALDGPALHIRHLGMPRSWDLRELQQMTVMEEVVSRVELGRAGGVHPADSIQGVTIPLPRQPAARAKVLEHIRHFVGHPDESSREFGVDLTPL